MQNPGATVWFTGLPCCGKTTIAKEVYRLLKDRGYQVEHLDGDVVREDLTSDLGFSKEDREKNLQRIAFVAKLLSRNNVIVLCTFVSPYQKIRDMIREKTTNFFEIFVNCPVEECIRRDVKGMYRKALNDEITNFTGIQDPYEPPLHPELIINSLDEEISESVSKVIDLLKTHGIIKTGDEF